MEKVGETSFENMPENKEKDELKEKYEGIISKIEERYKSVKEVHDGMAILISGEFENTREEFVREVGSWAGTIKNTIEDTRKEILSGTSQSPSIREMLAKLASLSADVGFLIPSDTSTNVMVKHHQP